MKAHMPTKWSRWAVNVAPLPRIDESIKIDLDMWFGHCELEQREVPGPDGIMFQGRSKHYDRNGMLTKVTEWETVSVLSWGPKPEPKVPWWKRLFA